VQAAPGGDQRVVARALGVTVVAAVSRDRAVDEPRVAGRKPGVVDAEPVGHARPERLDQNVGRARQRQKGGVIVGILQVEHRTALSAGPHAVAVLAGERVTALGVRALDADHVGTVVREHHRRHRTGDAPREIEDAKAVKDS
jgi:hypothetical protein